MFIFELKAQAARVMVDNELQRARIIEMLEELEEYVVTDAWADFPPSMTRSLFSTLACCDIALRPQNDSQPQGLTVIDKRYIDNRCLKADVNQTSI